MRAIQTEIPDLLIIEPVVFSDDRGFFLECFNRRKLAELVGRELDFVQDNHSRSIRNVLRGLHYQTTHPQGKLVRVVQGAVLDVAVDIRKSSPTFGRHVAMELSAENRRMLWIPEGFAHGFAVLTDTAECMYKSTDYWFPEHERCIRWDDADLDIDWRLRGVLPIVSVKDGLGRSFRESEVFP